MTNQVHIKIQMSSRETWDPCAVQYWGKLPGPYSLLLSSWPVCTWHKIIEFDSTLALPWERRSASEQQFNGLQAECVHQHHPYYANPSLGQYWTTSCSIALYGLVTMALASILLATKFCHCTSLVVSVEGYHQTWQPLQESLTACCSVMTKCMPVI